MNKAVVLTIAALMSQGGIALATDNSFGKLKVSADSIVVDDNDVMHAAGNVIVVNGATTIKMGGASLYKKNGKVTIEAVPNNTAPSK